MAVGARSVPYAPRTLLALVASVCLRPPRPALDAAATLQPPEQFIGFRVGADNKLVRWDKIVEYMKLAAAASDRVRVRELGQDDRRQPVHRVLVSAADTIKNLDRYKQLERRLYFQDGAPNARERDEIFRQGKVVVLDHVQRARDRDRADADGARAGPPARDRRFAGDEEDPRQRDLPARAERESGRPGDGHRLVQPEPRHAVRSQPAALPVSPVRRPRSEPRHVHAHAEGEPVHRAARVARLVSRRLAGSASDGQQRRAHVRDAGGRSDQPERASADLPVERHPRPVAGGGARGGRQGRHHLQLDLHELLAGGAGVERLVAQPDRPAHRGGERAHRGADRAASRQRRAARARPTAGAVPAARRDSTGAAAAADRHHAAHRVSAALDGRPLDAPRHRRLQLISTMALLETAADRRETILRQIYEVNRQTVEERRTRRSHGDPDRPR